MVITKKTRVKDITLLIPKNRLQEFINSFPPYPLDKPILSMSVGEFCNLIIDEDSFLDSIIRPRERAYIAFGRLHQYSLEMKNLSDYLKRFEIHLSQEEKAAGKGIDFPETPERIILDCVKAYHLHSTKEAEDLPITDWILILKDNVATAKYSRNYSKILEQKSKAHRKK